MVSANEIAARHLDPKFQGHAVSGDNTATTFIWV